MKVAICYADYFILMIFVRIILGKINDFSTMTSVSYATIYFSVTIITINVGVQDTLTAYLSEYLAKKDFVMIRKTVVVSTMV